MVAASAWCLHRAVQIFDDAGMILTKDEADEASEALLNHLRSYQYLANQYQALNLWQFRMKPKLHYMWHQAHQVKEWRLNPWVFHCFSEESFLGKIKAIAVQCHGATMCKRVLERYLICLALFLEHHRRQISGERA